MAQNHPHNNCQHLHGHPHGQGGRIDVEQLVERLKESGLKVTKPRQIFLKAILAFASPFSAEELFKSAKRLLKNNKCDLVTVYRSLATFTELGLLAKVDFGDGTVRYELTDPKGSHHHHFVCERCKRIEPLPLDFCTMQAHEKRLKELGYSKLSHRLEFFGLCQQCSPQSGN